MNSLNEVYNDAILVQEMIDQLKICNRTIAWLQTRLHAETACAPCTMRNNDVMIASLQLKLKEML